MKTGTLILLFVLTIVGPNLSAQNTIRTEKYGNTFNLGLGIGGYSGYYGYLGHTLPVVSANYEFDVARNFTLAPFVTLYSNRSDNYIETVIPVGGKGTYYFDQLLHANSKWDFYLAGSLGFALVNLSWNSSYSGNRGYYHNPYPLFFDFHIGTEYYLNNHFGLFLDISTGVSTIGVAFH